MNVLGSTSKLTDISRLHNQQAEIHALQKTLNSLHKETARLNSLLADTTGWQATLDEDNFLLETKITINLKVSLHHLLIAAQLQQHGKSERLENGAPAWVAYACTDACSTW